MNPPANNRQWALDYLRSPLEVTNVGRQNYAIGHVIRAEIIPTNRLILVLEGKLRYTIEDQTTTLTVATQFFVPAWVRRVWTVPQEGPCEIVWCEFEEVGNEGRQSGLLRRHLAESQLRKECAAYGQLLQWFRKPESDWSALHLEAVLKLMLTRFLERAVVPLEQGNSITPGEVHPKVKRVLLWVAEHFREPSACEALYREAGMSRNYFRELFVRATQCPPHEYVERLRLRHARYLLHHTDWQLKRIAAEVGYEDPLYFSRLYRRFWKRAPSEEREAGP